MQRRIVHLHADAPAKPDEGAACNGCGVCCAASPCPPGVLASGRLNGPCAALVWREADRVYRCGLVETPADWLPAALGRGAPLLARAARRFIAAGAGCDCSLVVEPAE